MSQTHKPIVNTDEENPLFSELKRTSIAQDFATNKNSFKPAQPSSNLVPLNSMRVKSTSAKSPGGGVVPAKPPSGPIKLIPHSTAIPIKSNVKSTKEKPLFKKCKFTNQLVWIFFGQDGTEYIGLEGLHGLYSVFPDDEETMSENLPKHERDGVPICVLRKSIKGIPSGKIPKYLLALNDLEYVLVQFMKYAPDVSRFMVLEFRNTVINTVEFPYKPRKARMAPSESGNNNQDLKRSRSDPNMEEDSEDSDLSAISLQAEESSRKLHKTNAPTNGLSSGLISMDSQSDRLESIESKLGALESVQDMIHKAVTEGFNAQIREDAIKHYIASPKYNYDMQEICNIQLAKLEMKVKTELEAEFATKQRKLEEDLAAKQAQLEIEFASKRNDLDAHYKFKQIEIQLREKALQVKLDKAKELFASL